VVLASLPLLGCGETRTTGAKTEEDTSAAVLVGDDALVHTVGAPLNLRAEASTSATILAEMPNGARLHVGGDAVNGFYAVTYQGQSGWAFGAYLVHTPPLGSLQGVVDALAADVGARSPGTQLAIAVRDLTTGEYASTNDRVQHVSASSAKAIWVAAALDGVGVDPVAPHAAPIFQDSDNDEAGAVIDLIGPDAINRFYQKANMVSSAFTAWDFGVTREASNSPRAMGSDNYFTAVDVVGFLAQLAKDSLLAPQAGQALRTWMTWSPRSGYTGWLGTLLPAGARAAMMHKAGWLPPGCCGDDAAYNTLNEIGLVQVPGGDQYAIAIFARSGNDYWGQQVPFVEHASCVIYQAITEDATIDCQ
jgi:beta-lactamase class A